ncbi:hypothetical protein C0992_010318, partial [Termitomyces sp. T32_za158]
NGTVPLPPMLWPPLPSAGSRVTSNRRASNGFMWVENLANSMSAKLLNYAWGGAVIDNFAWNTTTPDNQTAITLLSDAGILADFCQQAIQRSDFVAQTHLFQLQGKFLDSLVPSQTLYTVAFGIK